MCLIFPAPTAAPAKPLFSVGCYVDKPSLGEFQNKQSDLDPIDLWSHVTNVTWLKTGDRSWDPWVLKNLGAIIGWCLQHTEAESEWLLFLQRHFQMHFLHWMLLCFYWNITEVCSQGSSWQYVFALPVDDSALYRQQVITWTNDDPVYWWIYAASGLSKYTSKSSDQNRMGMQSCHVDRLHHIWCYDSDRGSAVSPEFCVNVMPMPWFHTTIPAQFLCTEWI